MMTFDGDELLMFLERGKGLNKQLVGEGLIGSHVKGHSSQVEKVQQL